MLKRCLPFSIILLVAGCKDPFEAELRASDRSWLVVEGVLNAGQGPTRISLTESVPVGQQQLKPVLQAQVMVESEAGMVYTFSESGSGNYLFSQLPMVTGERYRLRIKTAQNKEYLSDFVEARKAPEIDTITWKKDNDGLKFYVSTHDATNSTRYYNWKFDETWEIRSFYTADYKWTGDTVLKHDMYNYRCWLYDSSRNLSLGTTAQLEQDVLNEQLVHFIPLGSDKLDYRYSMLLKQQSLTKEAYQYLLLMKKNTESIGSIFDPQPSELRGNINCISDPGEGVIGYVVATTTTEKRIFVTNVEANWSYTENCPSIDVDKHMDSVRKWVPFYLPWGALLSPGGTPILYYMAPATCVDCTRRGGDLNMPSYW